MKQRTTIAIVLIALGVILAGAAHATQVNPPQSAFGVTGFIQEATVANVGSGPPGNPRLLGGSLTVNGIKMIIPNNTIIQMPAGAFTWADLFDPAVSASIGYNPPRPNHRPLVSGLALADNPLMGTRAAGAQGVGPYPSFMVSAVGNITTDPVTGAQRYIVGLIAPIEQQVLHNGAGLVSFIDYTTGRFRVGGIPGDPNTGTLCELNDPIGRWGLAHSPDPRFTSDTSWPTVHTVNGYPMGIPRVAPPAIDPDCPITNRPLNNITPGFPVDPFLSLGSPLRTYVMPASGGAGTTTPDPYKMVPLMVGDWVDYAGTMFKINPLGPNIGSNTFISVHTLVAHLSVKTASGTWPAYIAVEEFIFGVGDRKGGPTVSAGNPPTPIDQETSTRVTMVSFVTDSDPSGIGLPRGSIFGIYVDPTTGAETEIAFPNGAPPNPEFAIDDPIRGRLRWTTSNNGATAGVLANAAGPGKFYREYIVKISSGGGPRPLPTQANGLPGLVAGAYRLPIFEYIFGEGTTFGQPIPPFNFNDLGFLNVGDFFDGMPVGRLDPFPGP